MDEAIVPFRPGCSDAPGDAGALPSARPPARGERAVYALAAALAKAELAKPALPGGGAARLSIHEQVDRRLGGGLRTDALHEFYAAHPGDRASASAFALLLAELRARRDGGAVIWALERGKAQARPYGPGLAELGVDPARVTLLPLQKARDVLRAGLDCVREGEVGAVLIEAGGRQPLIDLTSTRRFQLAAEETGTMVLLLRGAADPEPSAAATRWQVGAAPSRRLETDAPGHPAFTLDLMRQRGGRAGLHLMLEWNRDTASFRVSEDGRASRTADGAAPLHGAVPAVARR